VRQLEMELGQTLLYRNGRGVTPTNAGRRLLAHARGILMQVRRARDELTETRDAMVGHVIFGMPPSVARLLTVPLVKSFRNSFPEGTFGVVEAMSAPIVEWLVEGRVDIGLVYNPAPLPTVEIRPLQEQEMYLVSSKAAGKDRQSPGLVQGCRKGSAEQIGAAAGIAALSVDHPEPLERQSDAYRRAASAFGAETTDRIRDRRDRIDTRSRPRGLWACCSAPQFLAWSHLWTELYREAHRKAQAQHPAVVGYVCPTACHTAGERIAFVDSKNGVTRSFSGEVLSSAGTLSTAGAASIIARRSTSAAQLNG